MAKHTDSIADIFIGLFSIFAVLFFSMAASGVVLIGLLVYEMAK